MQLGAGSRGSQRSRKGRERPRNKKQGAGLGARSSPGSGVPGPRAREAPRRPPQRSCCRPEDKARAVPGVPVPGNLLPGPREVPKPGPKERHTPLPLQSYCKSTEEWQESVSYGQSTTSPVLLPGERKWGMKNERLARGSSGEATVMG